jgi:hypothetical protein
VREIRSPNPDANTDSSVNPGYYPSVRGAPFTQRLYWHFQSMFYADQTLAHHQNRHRWSKSPSRRQRHEESLPTEEILTQEVDHDQFHYDRVYSNHGLEDSDFFHQPTEYDRHWLAPPRDTFPTTTAANVHENRCLEIVV